MCKTGQEMDQNGVGSETESERHSILLHGPCRCQIMCNFQNVPEAYRRSIRDIKPWLVQNLEGKIRLQAVTHTKTPHFLAYYIHNPFLPSRSIKTPFDLHFHSINPSFHPSFHHLRRLKHQLLKNCWKNWAIEEEENFLHAREAILLFYC